MIYKIQRLIFHLTFCLLFRSLNVQNDNLLRELDKSGVKYEVKDLKVGDFAWICRDRFSSQNELVLPYIIERKRMDDFAQSIKDRR